MNERRTFGILVAVDDSDAAARAVEYVVQVVGGRERFRIHLLHVLPPLPPSVLEHGGAESPRGEAELERGLEARRRESLEDLCGRAEPLFDRARAVLQGAGFASGAITTECVESVDTPAIARSCLESADANACGTIAIGRETLKGYREIVHRHVAESLVKQGAKHTIWVVE